MRSCVSLPRRQEPRGRESRFQKLHVYTVPGGAQTPHSHTLRPPLLLGVHHPVVPRQGGCARGQQRRSRSAGLTGGCAGRPRRLSRNQEACPRFVLGWTAYGTCLQSGGSSGASRGIAGRWGQQPGHAVPLLESPQPRRHSEALPTCRSRTFSSRADAPPGRPAWVGAPFRVVPVARARAATRSLPAAPTPVRGGVSGPPAALPPRPSPDPAFSGLRVGRAAQVRWVDEGWDVLLSRNLLFSPEDLHLRHLAKGRSSEPVSGVHRGHGLSLAAVT